MSQHDDRPDAFAWLLPVAFFAMLVALWSALVYAPTARIEGDIQQLAADHPVTELLPRSRCSWCTAC